MSSPTVQIKARPILSDMPFNIKSMIAENTDIKTRYTLRKVSTHFRAAVDNSKYSIDSLDIIISYSMLTVKLFGTIRTEYGKNGSDGCVVDCNGRQKQIEGEDYLQRAVDDVMIILKNPFVHLEYFWFLIHTNEESTKRRILEKLGSFRHRLSVGHLRLPRSSDPDDVLLLLRHLKPGVLKSLSAENVWGNCSAIVDSEHWPYLEEAWLGDARGVPISKFLHLRTFSTRNFIITKDVVKEVVQSFLQHPDNFEDYHFVAEDRDLYPTWKAALADYFPDLDLLGTENSARTTIPIPGSDCHLQIHCYYWFHLDIEFQKIRPPH